MKVQLYYLQNLNMGYLGNSPYWWANQDSGYTVRLADAKPMTAKEAQGIERSTSGTHKWKRWRVEDVQNAAYLTVDMQALHDTVLAE
jgi:hypothetical protein